MEVEAEAGEVKLLQIYFLAYAQCDGLIVDVGGYGCVLDGEADGFEEGYLTWCLASGVFSGDEFAQFEPGFGSGDEAGGQGLYEVACFGQRGFTLVNDDTRMGEGGGIDFAHGGGEGAYGVDVCAGRDLAPGKERCG